MPSTRAVTLEGLLSVLAKAAQSFSDCARIRVSRKPDEKHDSSV